MSNQLAAQQDNSQLISVLQASLYPGAKSESVELAVAYCKASGYDIMQKPVHIVPMPIKTGRKNAKGYDETEYRDVIMPGIGLYRIQAARTGQYAGITEPEFGPEMEFKGVKFPEWAKCTVKRQLTSGLIAEYTAKEYWFENFAAKNDGNPNAMWCKRPRGQIGKCVEAQALRKGFPEVGSAPTFEEMEGRTLDHDDASPPKVTVTAQAEPALPKPNPTLDAEQFAARLPTWAKLVENGKGDTPKGAPIAEKLIDSLSYTFTDDQKAQIRALAKPPVEVVEGESV